MIPEIPDCMDDPASSFLALVYPRYLENAVKMMGRDKEGVDDAMAGFISMLEDDKVHVPALLGMSLSFTLEDSPSKVPPTTI